MSRRSLRDRLRRVRLSSLVLLTVVPALVWPAVFLAAGWEYSRLRWAFPEPVTHLNVIPGSKVERLARVKLGALPRLLGWSDATERMTARPWANDEVHLVVPRGSQRALEADLPRSSEGYQPGRLRQGGRLERVDLRYRGNSGWHWLFERKSFKVRLPKRRLLRGARVLNLSVKQPYTTALALRVARAWGLLAPDADLVRVFVNGRYDGLMVRLQELDEGFLLARRRMPGTIYKGEGALATNEFRYGSLPQWLFRDPRAWGFHAHDPARPPQDREAIQAMAAALSRPEREGLATLEALFDLDEVARHVAYKLTLFEWHQGDEHNWKLYLDPTDGKLHPIVWDPYLHGNQRLEQRESFSRAAPVGGTPPLLNHAYHALGRDPRFCQRVWRFLHLRLGGFQEVSQVWKDLRAHARRNQAALAAEARQPLLPQGGRELHLTFKSLQGNRRRLLAAIGKARLFGFERGRAAVLGSLGVAGVRVSGLTLAWAGEAGQASVVADWNRNLRLDPGEGPLRATVARVGSGRVRVRFQEPLTVLPAYTGLDRTFTVALPHPLLLPAGAKLLGVEASNALTGAPVALERMKGWRPGLGEVDAVHPWDRRAPRAQVVTFAHPVHTVRTTLELLPHQTLRVSPGTEVRLAPGASIVCRGKVLAEGTAAAPIVFRARDAVGAAVRGPTAWGVLALQGAGASGSRFAHVTFSGGSQARLGRVGYSGMVSVHRARDVRFAQCTFQHNRRGDDALRAAHAQVRVRGCVFQDVNADALDFDASSGEVAESRFARIGNDAIDLMESSPVLRGIRIERCGDKGISIGERSAPLVLGARILRCAIGVQVKDRAQPLILHSDVSHCRVGVDVAHKRWRYERGGDARLINSRVAGNDRDLRVDARSRLEVRGAIVDGVDLAAARAGRLALAGVASSLTAAAHGAPLDAAVYQRFQQPAFRPRVGLLARARLVPRRVLLDHTFPPSFRRVTHGWSVPHGELSVGGGTLRAELAGPAGSLQAALGLALPGGARLHLRLGASRPAEVELRAVLGEASARRVLLQVSAFPRWAHLELPAGALSRIELRPKGRAPVTLRLEQALISVK